MVRGDKGEETVRSVPKPGRRVGIALPPDRVLLAVVPSAFAPVFGVRRQGWQDISLSYAFAARVERATSGFPALYPVVLPAFAGCILLCVVSATRFGETLLYRTELPPPWMDGIRTRDPL